MAGPAVRVVRGRIFRANFAGFVVSYLVLGISPQVMHALHMTCALETPAWRGEVIFSAFSRLDLYY